MAEFMDAVISIGIVLGAAIILGGIAWLCLTVWEYLKPPRLYNDDEYDDNDIFDEF